MEIYQLESPLEDASSCGDALFGAEAPFNPAFSNELFAEAPKASKQKTSKSRPVGPKPQAAKPAARAAEQGEQPIVQWQYVPLSQIRSRLDQPRQTFEPTALAELADSIRSRGVLQPILVREIAAPTGAEAVGAEAVGAEAVFQIVSGERRWRASQAAGLTQMPVLIQNLDDKAALEIGLIENLQREDLTHLEAAGALAQMIKQGYSIRELAKQLKKDKGWLEQRLLLTRLPEDLVAMVSGRQDTLTHARELKKVADPLLRAELIAQVRGKKLSLTALRRRVRQINKADLEKADLEKADLEKADLEKADLEKADLEQEHIPENCQEVDNSPESEGADGDQSTDADQSAEGDREVLLALDAEVTLPTEQAALLENEIQENEIQEDGAKEEEYSEVEQELETDYFDPDCSDLDHTAVSAGLSSAFFSRSFFSRSFFSRTFFSRTFFSRSFSEAGDAQG